MQQAEGDDESVDATLARQQVEREDPEAPAAGVVGDDDPPEPDEPG
jgi:hypothetical protein